MFLAVQDIHLLLANMKIHEILTEDKDKLLPKSTREAAIHAIQFDDIDQYYGMYRLGVAMAAEPGKGSPKKGPAKDNPTVWMYTDACADIVKKAAKNQGINGKTIVKKGPSSELKSINTVSPVATRKTNKYGV